MKDRGMKVRGMWDRWTYDRGMKVRGMWDRWTHVIENEGQRNEGVLLDAIRQHEESNQRLRSRTKYLKIQLRDIKEDSRRTELELLQELDMLHDKNSVMSRRGGAREESPRGNTFPARSASNVSQVSALSDTSMGSDEVFLTAHTTKEGGVITRDWEAKLKVRIESLERLLAEERQKVSMMERKLLLAGIDTTAPSVSDDVKLRIREKELLQDENLDSSLTTPVILVKDGVVLPY
ncbi:hypothetical protein Btru_057102 [Bulinus truncatus]|nr:hypothetical protein Btru_057102 [Bulinus truncatus]